MRIYNLKGEVIEPGEGNSIKSTVKKYFPDEVGSKTDMIDYREAKLTTIVAKMFSYEPMFLVAEFPRGKQKEYTKAILEIFNKEHKGHYFVDKELLYKYDLRDAIENGFTDLYFLERLGKPYNSYGDNDDNKIYSYHGDKRTIDLIFRNGRLVDFKIYGAY
nr:hypothetical protein [Allomuricauda sp.]